MTTRDEANTQRRAMADGRTHWHGCWTQHLDCMDRRIDERIAAALERVAKRFERQPIAGFSTALHGVAAELRAAEPAPSKPRHTASCRYMGDGDFQCGPDCRVTAWEAAQAAEPASKPLSVSEAMSRIGTSPSQWPEQVSHEVPVSEPVVAIGTNATGTNTPKSRDAGSVRATYTGVVSGDSGPVSRDTNGAAPPPPLVERLRKAAGAGGDKWKAWTLYGEAADALEAAQAPHSSADPLVKQLRAEANGSTLLLSTANTIEWYRGRYSELNRKLCEAQADTRRLDWLANVCRVGGNVRAAIDATMERKP